MSELKQKKQQQQRIPNLPMLLLPGKRLCSFVENTVKINRNQQ